MQPQSHSAGHGHSGVRMAAERWMLEQVFSAPVDVRAQLGEASRVGERSHRHGEVEHVLAREKGPGFLEAQHEPIGFALAWRVEDDGRMVVLGIAEEIPFIGQYEARGADFIDDDLLLDPMQ